MRIRVEKWIFGRLLDRCDLQTLRERLDQPQGSSRDLPYSLLTNRNLFNYSVSVVEYWLNNLPFCAGCPCIGRMDFVRSVSAGEFAVRGWLFSHHARIKTLELVLESHRSKIHALGLNRQDVSASLGFFRHASRSGFVGLLPIPLSHPAEITVGFSATLTSGQQVEGTFAPLQVEYSVR